MAVLDSARFKGIFWDILAEEDREMSDLKKETIMVFEILQLLGALECKLAGDNTDWAKDVSGRIKNLVYELVNLTHNSNAPCLDPASK